MDSTESQDDKDSVQDVHINFPTTVLNAIGNFLPNSDDFDSSEFNTVNYINSLFPTEQSLSNIDSVVTKMEYKLTTIDEEIQGLVRNQNSSRDEGQKCLLEANKLIKELSVQVSDINKKAERSEEMVREITSEIKQLDCAKINLTLAITTLNHFHMLVGGIETLSQLTEKRLYKEIVLPLQAIMEVMKHFESYKDIPQINDLREEVQRIRKNLGEQIMSDFKTAFTSTKSTVQHKTLADACSVVSVLDNNIKCNLLKWFIDKQLQEYLHLFSANQETAWLDMIDKRYSWIKKHLLKFEESLGSIFPHEWEVSERIVVEFCHRTKQELNNIMLNRRQEIDVNLLLHAIQKTYNFETLLDKRFTGVTLLNEVDPDKSDVEVREDGIAVKSQFIGIIGSVFESYLYLYIDRLDSNLRDLMSKFIQDAKSSPQLDAAVEEESQGSVLTSCADLFMFYKKCMVQCSQLTTGKPMLDLAKLFQKYLGEYANTVLQTTLPKQGVQTQQTLGSQVSSITRDIQNLSTTGIIQNFQSLLKEGDCVRFTKQELLRITSVITTSEYCLETTLHLEQKLKEKVTRELSEQIDFTPERDLFHRIISNAIQLLVQDLEIACEPSLVAMTKITWQNINSVGDQSNYISQIIQHLRTSIPTLRDNLASSRKYFTQFCIKFANSFIPKFIQNIYKCKPISTVGSEQLLLDAHMLKTVLLELPSLGSSVKRQAPTTYTKVVIKLMSKAELILKLVMSPLDSSAANMESFVSQFVKLLPECNITEFRKVIQMKNVKLSKAHITTLDHLFRSKMDQINMK